MRAALSTFNSSLSRGRVAAVVGSAALLASSAVALAATPKHGARFTGKTDASPVNGFVAPVAFKVAANGKSLTGFRYSSFGCFGAGGFRPGIDYYTKPGAIFKVGTLKVTAGGHFSVKGAVSKTTSFGVTYTTTSSVKGTFTKSKAANGTIMISQKATGKFNESCGPGTITFTASAH